MCCVVTCVYVHIHVCLHKCALCEYFNIIDRMLKPGGKAPIHRIMYIHALTYIHT